MKPSPPLDALCPRRPDRGAMPFLVWDRAAAWAPAAAVIACLVGAASFLLPGLWAVLWLVSAVLAGAMLTCRLFPALPVAVALPAAYLSGLVVCGAASFLLALVLSPFVGRAVLVAGVLVTLAVLASALRGRAHRDLARLRPAPLELAVLLAALLFALWFYGKALSYDERAGEFTYAPGTYADIAVHVALARSFAWGDNLPPEYPYYGGPPIHYHFGYDFTAGLLESLGLRLDLAFNLPVALAFASLFLLVFALGRALSGRVWGGLVATVLLPLTTSWAFLDYLARWSPTPAGFLRGWWGQTDRIHLGPYNPETISIHFTLMPFLIERQLLTGLAAGVVVVAVLALTFRAGHDLSHGQAEGLGALLGLVFLFNGLIWLAALTVAGALFVLFGRWRTALHFGVYAVMVALPAAALVRGSPLPSWHVGFVTQPFNLLDYAGYWWENLGLLVPLALAGALFGTNADRRLLFACFAPFLLASVLQLGGDLSGVNQKVFNFWIVLLKPFVALALVRIVAVRRPRRWAGPLAGVALGAALVPSGLIDLAQIKNGGIADLPGSDRAAVNWVAEHTPPDARFLTAHWLMMPPSLAGRPLYLGYRPWVRFAGYDVAAREQTARQIYGAPSPHAACALLRREGIAYVQVGPVERDAGQGLSLNAALWDAMPTVFDGPVPGGRLRYYDGNAVCGRAPAP